MTKLVSTAQSPDFLKYWVTIPEWKHTFATGRVKALPLSSTFEINYLNLITKIDKLNSVPEEGDDAEYFVAEQAAAVAKSVVRELEELKIIEKGIAIHLFSNYEKGIQIELDGAGVKADIETMEDGFIALTTYTGERNNAETNRFAADSLDLIAEFLNISEMVYA
jgi:hypothetical protein